MVFRKMNLITISIVMIFLFDIFYYISQNIHFIEYQKNKKRTNQSHNKKILNDHY